MASIAGGILSPLTSLFSFGDKGYLAIDIGSNSIKVLEVKGKGKGLRIINAGIAPLSSDAIQDNVVRSPALVAEAIRTLIEDQGLKATNVLTVVPGPAVIIKRANFPAQDQKDLRETILFEAGNFIPESLDNVNLDYQVLDTGSQNNTIDVLLVAVRKDLISSYTSAIEEAGLIPVVADVDYFALENMFETNYSPDPEETIALINIGAHYSLVNVMKGNRSAFTGDVQFGGKHFTDMVAEALSLSEEEAEDAKINGVLEGYNSQDIERIVTTASDHLLDEIQHTLSFFGTGTADEQITAVYLSGGTAQLPSLASMISQRLSVPVEVSDPFRNLRVSGQHEEFIRSHAASFAISAGLATRRPGDR
ncbi:MAG: type IV pilus assembly protein PilM [Deltaproteobacteria bacterium]|nr:type IV pilus assembly protein PilM [Deltaproteobacteria bacterium]